MITNIEYKKWIKKDEFETTKEYESRLEKKEEAGVNILNNILAHFLDDLVNINFGEIYYYNNANRTSQHKELDDNYRKFGFQYKLFITPVIYNADKEEYTITIRTRKENEPSYTVKAYINMKSEDARMFKELLARKTYGKDYKVSDFIVVNRNLYPSKIAVNNKTFNIQYDNAISISDFSYLIENDTIFITTKKETEEKLKETEITQKEEKKTPLEKANEKKKKRGFFGSLLDITIGAAAVAGGLLLGE